MVAEQCGEVKTRARTRLNLLDCNLQMQELKPSQAKVDLKLAHTQNINPDLPTSSLVACQTNADQNRLP